MLRGVRLKPGDGVLRSWLNGLLCSGMLSAPVAIRTPASHGHEFP